MYDKVSTDLKFVDREKQVEKFWEENHIFEKSIDSRREGETYTFYDGPPTANGKPHIGHVLTRVIKDMIPRYRTMKGYMVPRKAGWDTHEMCIRDRNSRRRDMGGLQIGIMADSLRLPFRESIEKCAELGADGVQLYAVSGEMSPDSMTEESLYEKKSILKGYGLRVSALCGDFGGHGFTVQSDNEKRIRASMRVLELALNLSLIHI